MKYTVLHGAKENCGDFLIRDSAIELLKSKQDLSDGDIYTAGVVRTELSSSQIEKIKKTDVAYLAGGPGYREDFYPGVYPSLSAIMDVTKLVPLGPGWKGQDESDYLLSDESIQSLEDILDQPTVPFLGARDLPSVRILRRNGLAAELTGCPAWYHYDGYPPQPTFETADSIDKIVLSTPPKYDYWHLVQYIYLIRTISKEFPNSSITLVFHRGEHRYAFNLHKGADLDMVEKNIASGLYGIINQIVTRDNFELYDASGSAAYVRQYFDADLHIGYRVHAHIPSLVAGTPSFLLQIDGRGTGVSESLGTPADVYASESIRKPVHRIVENIRRNRKSGFYEFREVQNNVQSGYENMSKLLDETM